MAQVAPAPTAAAAGTGAPGVAVAAAGKSKTVLALTVSLAVVSVAALGLGAGLGIAVADNNSKANEIRRLSDLQAGLAARRAGPPSPAGGSAAAADGAPPPAGGGGGADGEAPGAAPGVAPGTAPAAGDTCSLFDRECAAGATCPYGSVHLNCTAPPGNGTLPGSPCACSAVLDLVATSVGPFEFFGQVKEGLSGRAPWNDTANSDYCTVVPSAGAGLGPDALDPFFPGGGPAKPWEDLRITCAPFGAPGAEVLLPTAIEVTGANIKGQLPASIGSLAASLTKLYLSNNHRACCAVW